MCFLWVIEYKCSFPQSTSLISPSYISEICFSKLSHKRWSWGGSILWSKSENVFNKTLFFHTLTLLLWSSPCFPFLSHSAVKSWVWFCGKCISQLGKLLISEHKKESSNKKSLPTKIETRTLQPVSCTHMVFPIYTVLSLMHRGMEDSSVCVCVFVHVCVFSACLAFREHCKQR